MIQRLILDWHWDGRNANKSPGHEDKLHCPWCGRRDSQQHWMSDCGDTRLLQGRAAIFTNGRTFLQKKSQRFREIGHAILEYAAEANHGNRVLLGLWESDAMDWLHRRIEEVPGDGTSDAQLERFMLSFQRHLAIDVLALWSVRNGMMTKHEKEVHKLVVERLRHERQRRQWNRT
jgi:hypothetical protein